MRRTTRSLLLIWLVTTAVVVVTGVVIFRSLTAVDDLAGRTDPAVLWDDPTELFRDPGIIGTAIELQVTEAVRSCMAEQGLDYRGPAVADDLPGLLDPATAGYGIAAGVDTPRPILGAHGPSGLEETAYEIALYGSTLDVATERTGCAAVGHDALLDALATLEAMPYSIDQLEADALADPEYNAALEEWRACMTDRGWDATSPDQIMAELTARLGSLGGDDARALADEERRVAVDDFACRASTLDPATSSIAERLAPRFVEENRSQLSTLIPPPGTADLPAGLGGGDVQVTIVWRSDADLDLYVTDPTGFRIYFSDRTSPSGGSLDRDANYPCLTDSSSPAAENVYWPTGTAPSGRYTVVVRYTNDCSGEGRQTFDLVVQVRGSVIHRSTQTLDTSGDSYTFEFEVRP